MTSFRPYSRRQVTVVFQTEPNVHVEISHRAEQILRLPRVEERTGLSRSSIYSHMAAGSFPRPIRLAGGNAVGWLESEIQAWIDAQVRATRGEPSAAPTAA